MNYGDVQRVYRLEKNTPTLTEIKPDFFEAAGSLMESVEEHHRESLARLFGEIIGRRRRKILMHALRMEDANTPPTNVTPIEDEFYRDLVGVLMRHKKKLLSQKKPEPAPEPEPQPQDTTRVRLLRALPEIVGGDGERYGPYMEGDVADIPPANAEVLIREGAAEEPDGG